MVTSLFVLVLAVQGVTQPPPLEGEWNVEVVDSIKVMPDSRVTIRFQGTRVAGVSSCNSYSGTYTVDGTSLRTSGILSTMKACSPELMSQERDFMFVLRNTARYELQGTDTLVLLTRQGRAITARRK